MIQPIETLYKGYRFRSRTEARWAVFFDALGIRFEYEPEGFKLTNGNYLPDFYLPEFHVFAEVKRDFDGDIPEELVEKLRELANDSGLATMLLDGQPETFRLYKLFCNDTNDSGGGSYDGSVCFRTRTKTNEPVLIAWNDLRSDRSILTTDWLHTVAYTRDGFINFNLDKVQQAVERARGARFEFGERGTK